MDIERLYPIPANSFFLLGPRGVGKSTWVRSRVPFQIAFDLLKSSTFLALQRDPSSLEARTAHLKEGAMVFIDEIQRLPDLLNEVHRLIENRHLRFALTGSSARKLKRHGTNLLAGRAHTYKMFPFSLRELGTKVRLRDLLTIGALPVVLKDLSTAEETLHGYVDTYLREEIKEEALVRRFEEFARFLSVSSQLNAQILSFENVARDCGKKNATVQNWYQLLDETLIGSKLPPYRPGFKVREIGHPKFYWFDAGVARVAAGYRSEDIDGNWLGFAFESLILNELRIYNECSRNRYPINYYATPGAGEIDFIVETCRKTTSRPAEFISIEVKYSERWKRDYESSSRALRQFAGTSHRKMIGVYAGNERLTFDGFEVFPVRDFVDWLHRGGLTWDSTVSRR